MNKINRKKRTAKKSALYRLKAWLYNQERRVINMAHSRRKAVAQLNEENAVKNVLINKMTNWQRNKFLIAFKGDLRNVSVNTYQDYLGMPHWKQTTKQA